MKHVETGAVEGKLVPAKTVATRNVERVILYDGSRCHKIRQVVNSRANKQQDLQTIELRSEALLLLSVSRAKVAVN